MRRGVVETFRGLALIGVAPEDKKIIAAYVARLKNDRR